MELGGRDGFLATFVPGDRTKDEVKALARNGPAEDTPENRRIGWARMCLLVLYFQPSGACGVCLGWKGAQGGRGTLREGYH